MKRFTLPETVTTSAIPSLTARQFVVDRSELSSEQIILEKEIFWYRQELLAHVRANWKEVVSICKYDKIIILN